LCKDSKECGKISRSFQDLNDLRGSFVQFPMINGSQRFYIQNAIKTKKAERLSFYLKIPNPFEAGNEGEIPALMVDRRNRKKNAQEHTNSTDQKRIMRKRLFVALHHFHPRMIDPKCGIARVDCNGTRFKLPDLVTISKIKSEGLMEYYSPDDRYDQDMSLIVPNYPLIKSEEDLTRIYKCIQPQLSQDKIYSINSCLPTSKRTRDDEVLIINQSVKRLKSCNKNVGDSMDGRMELKLMNDTPYNMGGALEKGHSRLHAINAYHLNLVRSRQTDTLRYKEGSAIHSPTGDALLVESLSKVNLINNLQKRISDMERDYFIEALSLSMHNNQYMR